jgi:ATP-binding cassette subfamily F protein 3
VFFSLNFAKNFEYNHRVLLAINNLDFYFGGRPIYQNANLHIKPKDRIGLIGANGTGKSTLLRLIVGEYTSDKGNITMANDCTLGFLNQDLLSYQSNDSILGVAKEAFAEQNALQIRMDEIIHQLETDYSEELVHDLSACQERFETLGGYTIGSQAEEVLEGLGFKTEDLDKPLKEFSGGWRMRVMLAKLLLQKPSLLMLDEPTNHLDLPSIQWVENYIQNYEGAIILVSHDRRFMENAAQIIVEVSNQQLNYYGGDYEFYEQEKVLRNEIQQAAYENQQQKIKQTEKFIERFRAKATKARQVQSRVKALDRLDRIDEVDDEAIAVSFKFNFGQPSGKQVLELKDISKSYGDLKILEHTGATIMRGDKIALIGANGKGKSTLLRILVGTEPSQGTRSLGHNVRYAFFAQHQLESLRVENDMLSELMQAGSGKSETELRNLLGCFLFTNDDVFKRIKVLSGGEKSRVALAKVLISEANFLLLDEPTNHLDVQSVSILVQALQQYAGTYVVVSHDRHFLSQVANKIWYIEDDGIKEYPGTYEEYEEWRKKQVERAKSQPSSPAPKKKKEEKKPINPADQQAEKELKAFKKQLAEKEDYVTKLEGEQAKLEIKLADTSLYQNEKELLKTQKAYDEVKQKMELVQSEWEEIAFKIEEMES